MNFRGEIPQQRYAELVTFFGMKLDTPHVARLERRMESFSIIGGQQNVVGSVAAHEVRMDKIEAGVVRKIIGEL